MTMELVTLHTGRQVPEIYLRQVLAELSDQLTENTLAATCSACELADLAGQYLAENRTGPVGEPEARRMLPFGYSRYGRSGLISGGRLQAMTMDILAATLANSTGTGYDLLNPISGELVEHRQIY